MAVYLDLDGALDPAPLGLPRRDAREWGPRLRCFAPRSAMQTFIRDVLGGLPPFVVYGSGDFHHLAAALLRKLPAKPFNLVSFDNHPDWDIRPPHWACGGWMKRALELPHLERAVVWGCGNFELNFPARIFGSRRVEVHAWAERYPNRGQMTRNNWRTQFEEFADSMRDRDVYITVDMDCLREEDAVTNWESGLFSADEVAWAIGVLRAHANVIGGDVCGAYSPPIYERRKQRFAAEWDHPKVTPPDPERARQVNTASLQIILPALTTPTPARSQR
ncbi:MAG TPA: arginase family protein [Thermoanaerobaculia bacterium]